MTDLIILAGTRHAIPDDLLSAHIRHARRGGRLLIVDEGGLAAFHADQSRDLLIDPGRSNWDLASDCRDEAECVCVAEALIEQCSFLFMHVATRSLTEVLLDFIAQPRADLGHLSATVRGISPEFIELPPSISDPGQRVAITVLAVMKSAAGSFPPRDQRTPLTSFRRWYDNPAGRVLYLFSPPGDDVAAAVRRAILALAQGPTAITSDHALIACRAAPDRDAGLAA